MLIQTTRRQHGFALELNGRLDADWSAHVENAIEAAVQNGEHAIAIDLQNVHYISSAGVGVLIKYHKRLTAVQGSLRVLHAAGDVLTVLKLMKLTWLLTEVPPTLLTATPNTEPTIHDHAGCRIEVQQLPSQQPLNCTLLGSPELFNTGRLDPATTHPVRFETNSCGLGLGAFNAHTPETGPHAHCVGFGESLGVAGAVIQQATDGSRVPDFQLAAEELVPSLHLLYGMHWSGEFPSLIRFEAARRNGGSIPLSELTSEILRLLNCHVAAFVFVAESAAVVGARLIQSPLGPHNSSPFDYPAIRDWLSFFSQPDRDPKLTLITGIAARNPQPELAPFLRPMADDDQLAAHFHAALFHYSPLPKGVLNLQHTVKALFHANAPQSVWHLLRDGRAIEGVGETELMRGACWCGPLSAITHSP
ncbi:MAG: hypothetical protein RLZZ436_4029 [Planctomycetota bacterium]|jgi:anti-anti-sigma factor